MTSLALRRGQGPACLDLPPTLQPHAVLSAAPHPDHLRSALGAAAIYVLLGLATFAVARTRPALLPPPVVPPTERPPVDYEGLSRIVLARPAAGPSAGGQAAEPGVQAQVPRPQGDPEEAAPGQLQQNRALDVPLGGTGTPSVVAPIGPPAATGPMVRDIEGSGLAVLHRVEPPYPELARKARIQGMVVLAMLVDEQGVPVQVRALEGHPALQEAALQAARQWRFEPARMEGHPVSASFKLTLNFRLR
jgi:protein TonB